MVKYAIQLITSSIFIWIWTFFVNTHICKESLLYSFIIANLFVASWSFFNIFIILKYKKNFFDIVNGKKEVDK